MLLPATGSCDIEQENTVGSRSTSSKNGEAAAAAARRAYDHHLPFPTPAASNPKDDGRGGGGGRRGRPRHKAERGEIEGTTGYGRHSSGDGGRRPSRDRPGEGSEVIRSGSGSGRGGESNRTSLGGSGAIAATSGQEPALKSRGCLSTPAAMKLVCLFEPNQLLSL